MFSGPGFPYGRAGKRLFHGGNNPPAEGAAPVCAKKQFTIAVWQRPALACFAFAMIESGHDDRSKTCFAAWPAQ
jgi:hypothetical protein